jgi:hypothetical protein
LSFGISIKLRNIMAKMIVTDDLYRVSDIISSSNERRGKMQEENCSLIRAKSLKTGLLKNYFATQKRREQGLF